MKLTPEEIADEIRFRFAERVAFLCQEQDPEVPPTLDQMQLADAEAEAWRERYHKENP